MRSQFKVGIIGAVAALLVAIGAFGFGGATTTQANIEDECGPNNNLRCVYVVAEHGIDTANTDTTSLITSCEEGAGFSETSQFGIAVPDTALHIDTTNFPNFTGSLPLIRLATGDSVLICVNADGIDEIPGTSNDITGGGPLSFDSNDHGTWDRPACGDFGAPGPDTSSPDGDGRLAEWPDDRCMGPVGVNTDHLVIAADPNGATAGFNDLTTVIVRFNCGSFVGTTTATIQQDQESFQFLITCRGNPDDINVTCSPCTVEIVPARGNTAHSLIQVFGIDDDDDNFFSIIDADVDFRTDRCAIETGLFTGSNAVSNLLELRQDFRDLSVAIPSTFRDFDEDADDEGIDEGATSRSPTSDVGSTFDVDSNIDGTVAAAILHCDVHAGVAVATPGIATVSVCWERVGATDICRSVQVTVIGPPASITVAAAPTSLRCGEKSTITATVKDAIGQNVSDHTRVEMITNLGGTLAGQGAVAGFAGPVVPISSSVGDTFGGVATAFLITSEVTSGPYEVVATSGGTSATDFKTGTHLGGVFSTPPVSAQVTVTCNIPAAAPAGPAPTITAPRTGTGITPPNTGDAGLADSSASWTLFAIGGIVALSLAGFATVKAASRR